MKTTYIEICERGQRKLKRAIGDQFVVGRGAKADVPLPFTKELDPHHLLCVPGEAGMWLSVAEGARPPILSDGQAVRRGTVPWGTAIQIGKLELIFHSRRPASNSAGRVARIAIICTAVAGAFVVMQLLARADSGPIEPRVPPPDLFADPGPCRLDPVTAVGAARESAEAAHSKAERYSYRVMDGVAAISYYLVAERCFKAGGDQEAAERMRRERESLRQQIENEYRVSHVKLEKTLRAGELEEAQAHTRSLLAFTEAAPGEYRDWLIAVERELGDRIAAKKAKKEIGIYSWFKQSMPSSK